MPQDMKLPDGSYGTPDPDQPHIMTLWWVHKRKMKTWPPKHRWAPFPPKAPAELDGHARREWRDAWYDSTYWPWKQAVIDAIAAGLDTARANFAEHVAPEDRPVIPAAGKKPKTDKVRNEEIKAAFLYDVRGLSLEDVMGSLNLPQTTAWRRIESGRLLLAQVQDAIDRVKAIESRSPWLIAADLMDAQSGELPRANP
ncbi:hypothetical protein [Nonomuraea sp. bgisy101]|uniref:hypothetical protein n=1 Tax=Nonomuraea sp. bgisy101 TaxID=3413784 RepID=UPI003D74D1F6